jgi:hypothetical protein
VLELRDLARRYGDVVALDGVSLTVEAGQRFGFVGLVSTQTRRPPPAEWNDALPGRRYTPACR